MTLTRTAAGQDSSARRHSEFKSARAETHEWPSESSIGIKCDDKTAMHRRINCSVIVANQMHGARGIEDERTMPCAMRIRKFKLSSQKVGY